MLAGLLQGSSVGALPGSEHHAAELVARPAAGIASLTDPGVIIRSVPATGQLHRSRILALFHRALRHEEAGDNESALAAYLEIIKGGDYAVQVAERAATLLAATGERQRALEILEAATERLPESPAPRLALCRFHVIFAENGEASLDQAVAIARDTTRKFPQSPEAISQLVALLRSRGELAEVREFLRGPARDSAMKDRDAGRMLEVARAASKVWPTNRANTREQHLEQVDSLFEETLALAGDQSTILIAVAEYFAGNGRLERARQILEQVTTARPGLLEQRFRLADIRKALGDDSGYLAELESLIAIDPHNPDTHRSLSTIYHRDKDYQRASRHLQTSLDLAPGKLADHLRLSRLYHATGEYDRACRTSERAIVLFPASTEARYLGAIARTRLADYAAAVDGFRSAEALAEEHSHIALDGDFYFEFGVALERSGDLDQATEKFRTALDLVPEDDNHAAAKIYNHLGYAWLENNLHTEQAGEMIKRANELAPDIAAYVDSLGWFHHVQGEHAEAEKHFDHAWQLLVAECRQSGLEPIAADAVILEHAAQAKIALGKIPAAIATLRKALELAPGNPTLQALLAEIAETEPTAGDSPTTSPPAPGNTQPTRPL